MKQLIQSKPKEDLEKNKGKGKKIIDIDKMEYTKIETQPRSPKTRGLKRALDLERHSTHPPKQLTFDEIIAMEINQDKVLLLG